MPELNLEICENRISKTQRVFNELELVVTWNEKNLQSSKKLFDNTDKMFVVNNSFNAIIQR